MDIFYTCGTSSAAEVWLLMNRWPRTECEIISITSEILRKIIGNKTMFSMMLGWCSWSYPTYTIVPLFMLIPQSIKTTRNSIVVINELRKLMCNGFNNAIETIHGQLNII